jgi:hypothetical protein
MTTPNFGLRYPALSDPPDVVADIRNLAEDVDADLLPIQTAAARNAVRAFGARLAADTAMGALADVPGVTVTFSTANANTQAMITISLDATTTGGNYVEGVINIDGVDRIEKCHAAQTGVGSETASQTINWTFAAAGSHTVKLRAIHSGGASSLNAARTGIAVLVLGP